MHNRAFISYSPGQTKLMGEKIAKSIIKNGTKKAAVVLALEGGLGGGKTTFLQGFAKGLGIKEKVLSPTFILMKKYQIPSSKPPTNSKTNSTPKFSNFYHIDCYRISKPKEILALGFKEIIANPYNIVAVEWASRLKRALPKKALLFRFEFQDRNKRIIKGVPSKIRR